MNENCIFFNLYIFLQTSRAYHVFSPEIVDLESGNSSKFEPIWGVKQPLPSHACRGCAQNINKLFTKHSKAPDEGLNNTKKNKNLTIIHDGVKEHAESNGLSYFSL